jgi:hypothetical protein
MSKIFLAFVDQHKFGGVGIQSFIKYRGKQFPYPAQNRNWSKIFSIIRFPLVVEFLTFFKTFNETPHNIDNDHDLLDIEPHFINTPINAEITTDDI